MRFSWIHYLGRISAQLLSSMVVQIILSTGPMQPAVAVRATVNTLVRELVATPPNTERASGTGGLLNEQAPPSSLAQPGQGWG
jgi:hypothetical protein